MKKITWVLSALIALSAANCAFCENGELRGRVVDASERALSGVDVALVPSETSELSVVEAVSDEEGLFSVSYPKGEYEYLVLQKEGFARFADQLGSVEGREEKEEPVLFHLYKGLHFSGRVAENLTNRPIKGANVWAVRKQTSGIVPAGQEMFHAISDSSGDYRIEGLMPGQEFSLVAHAPGMAPDEKKPLRPGTGNMDFMLNQGGSISGVVRDGEGRAAAGVTIVLLGKNGHDNGSHKLYEFLDLHEDEYPKYRYELETDEEGKFSVGSMDAGSYKLAGYKDDMVAVLKDRGSIIPMSLAEDVADLEMYLMPGGSIAVQVKNKETDESIGAAKVVLRFEEFDLPFMQGETDGEGSCILSGLSDAEYALEVSAKGFTSEKKKVTVSESGRVNKEVFLEPEKTLEGTVTNEDGEPIPGAWVARMQENRFSTWVSRKVQSDDKGHFKIDGLPKENVTIKATAKEYATTLLTDVETGKRDFSIVLERGAILEGTVSDLSRAVVEGATVAVSPVAAMEDWAEKKNRRGTTGADGSYRLVGLEPGLYTVTAYTDTLFCSKEEEFNAVLGKTGKLDFTLKKGITVSGEVVLQSLADTSESAISGVTVEVSHEGYHFEKKEKTDGDGRFAVENVPEGIVRVTARTSGGYSPKTISVDVYASEEDVDGVKFIFKKAAGISGFVMNGERQPIGDGEISVETQMFFMSKSEQSVVSDGTGYFEFDTLDANTEFRLTASAEGYAAKKSEAYTLAEGEWKRDIEIVLSKGGSISGRVTDASGEPISGVKVAAMASLTDAASKRINEQKTDSEGYYRIERVSAGQTSVVCEPPSKNMRFGMDSLSQMFKTVLVREGQETKRVDFQFNMTQEDEDEEEDEPEDDKEGVSIRGRVVDESGRPITGVSVSAQPQDYSQMMRGSFGFANTNANGEFEMEDLTPGKYKVEAKTKDRFSSESVTATAPTEDLEIVLSRKGAISGLVVYKTTGQPVTEFTIEIPADFMKNAGGMGAMPSAETLEFYSPHGEFLMEDVEKGTHTLVFHVKGWASTEMKGIEVEGGKTTEGIMVEIGEGGSVTGIVLSSADDAPVEGAKVAVNVTGANPAMRVLGITQADQKMTKTDIDGLFHIENMNPGSVVLEVSHPDFASARKSDVTIVDGEESESVIIYLNQGGTLQGTVYGTDGQVLPNENVVAFTMDMSERYEARTNEKGFYEIKCMVPNNYSVMLGDFMNIIFRRSGVSSKSANIKEGEVTEVNFGESGAMVYGRVTRRGEPVKNAQVSVRTSIMPFGMDFSANGRTDDDGNYQIQGLENGQFFVMLFGEGLGFYPMDRKQIEIPEAAGAYEVNLAYPDGAVTGQVVSATNGNPIELAKVSLQPSEGGPLAQFAMFLSSLSTTSDEEGRFTLSDVPYDKYDLLAAAEGYGQELTSIDLVANTRVENVVVRLGAFGAIEARVTDASSGEPLIGYVNVKNEAGKSVATNSSAIMSHQKSPYRIELSPGTYEVYVSSGEPEGGYEPKAMKGIEIKSNETTAIDFKLTKGQGLNVTILFEDQSGGPVNDFKATITDQSGRNYDDLCEKVGSSVVGSLPKGVYTLSVTSESFVGFERTLDLTHTSQIYSEKIVLERR